MQENPYYDYSSVRDLDMFFGRREILQAIFAACKQRQCFSLVGTRKIGKSSVLMHMQSIELQRRLGVDRDLQHHIFIYIDMRNYLQHTLSDFFQELSAQIVMHAPEHLVLHPAGEKSHETFTRNLQDLHGAGYHLVLMMDVFDKVEDEQQFGPNFFSFLRAPSTKGWISYITASLKPLYLISPIEAASSPFFDNFKVGYLGALSQEEARQLVTVPAERAGLPFDESEKSWMSEVAGRHPFFLQVTGQQLFEEKARQAASGRPIDYQAVTQRIYDELFPYCDRIWNELLPEQQRELKQETRQSAGSRQRLDELSECVLFRRYVREQSRQVHGNRARGQAGFTVKNLKEALTRLDDRAFLQNSPLAELCALDSQHDGGRAATYRRGQLLQEYLRQAFERMKPEGARSDHAPEWRLYNTLYYHYFTKSITNDQAAARLGISLRQFYRDQERALQALIQELLDVIQNP